MFLLQFECDWASGVSCEDTQTHGAWKGTLAGGAQVEAAALEGAKERSLQLQFKRSCNFDESGKYRLVSTVWDPGGGNMKEALSHRPNIWHETVCSACSRVITPLVQNNKHQVLVAVTSYGSILPYWSKWNEYCFHVCHNILFKRMLQTKLLIKLTRVC